MILSRLGHATETTAFVLAYSDTAGTVSLSIGGTVVDSAAVGADDTVRLVAIGLEADKKYHASILFDGANVDALTLRTMPAGGEWAFAWSSCMSSYSGDQVSPYLQRKYDLRAFFEQGDYPYCNYSGTSWGETSVRADKDSVTANGAACLDVPNYRAVHRKFWRTDGRWQLTRTVPFYVNRDDHESPGDNWDHSIAKCNFTSPGDATNMIGATTQEQVDAIWFASQQACVEYMARGNPDNGDPLAIPEKPPSAAASTNVSNYPVMYFDFVVGQAHFIVPDCISYRSSTATADGPGKTMLGANQKAWLKSRLLASTSPYKIVMINKKLYRNLGDNNDIYAYYGTERDELLDFCDTNNIKGVVWLAGDTHVPDVEYDDAKQRALCVCACPAGSNNLSQLSGYQTNIRYKGHGNLGVPRNQLKCAGVGIVTDEYLELRIESPAEGMIWAGRIYPGSNSLVYTASRS